MQAVLFIYRECKWLNHGQESCNRRAARKCRSCGSLPFRKIRDTKNQLKTVQKIEHNLAYMDSAKIFCLQFYWLLV